MSADEFMDAMDAAQIKYHEAHIEAYEEYAKTCLPSRIDRINLWVHKTLTGWFFLLGTAQFMLLHKPILGCINYGTGTAWIFLTRMQLRLRKKENERRLEWLRDADKEREKLALIDPTNAHLTLIIEEEP